VRGFRKRRGVWARKPLSEMDESFKKSIAVMGNKIQHSGKLAMVFIASGINFSLKMYLTYLTYI